MNQLDAEHDIRTVIHGGATGADGLAGLWASSRKKRIVVYPANWKLDGKAAGPIRNDRMLRDSKPDLVVAFPGGRGTADMVNRARRAGVEVKLVSRKGGDACDSSSPATTASVSSDEPSPKLEG